ncbi:MAG: amylo-alpha-1,6-glucosidase, partial [Methanosarcinales archaeon]
HWREDIEDGLLVGRDNKVLSLRTPICNIGKIRRYFRVFNWWYKLGSGFRENINGTIIFKGENKNPVSFGEIEIPANRNTIPLIIAAGTSKTELNRLFEMALKEYEENEKKEIAQAKAIISALGNCLNGEVAFRALALTKYGMYVDGHLFHEAGDFWFRTPWLRDEFEGLLNNIKTFMKIPRGREIVKNIILRSLAYQDQFGRVPNRFLERKEISDSDYNSADATLLAFIVAGEYLKYIKDKEFAKKVLKHADITIEGFKILHRGNLDKVNGAPVLHENGLISVVPWHSWTDGKRSFRVGDITLFLPIRVPVLWENDLIQRYGIKAEEELNKPKYFLPEINAQWIRMLESCVLMADLIYENKKNYLDLLKNANSNFRKVFYSENFLYNLVTIDGKKDPTLGSPAVVAISLLSDFIHEEELKKFTSVIKENLLIKRKRVPFGILVRKSDKQIYYGDNEYHEAMVWPRDTPYLIHILLKTGERDIVKVLLKSNLDHQMTEGFLFYNSELFSPDDGKVVPVKNPVQWWSQWVDPFLSF